MASENSQDLRSGDKTTTFPIAKAAVIGAGPAGKLAALAIAPFVGAVHLFERDVTRAAGSGRHEALRNYGYTIVAGGVEAIRSIDHGILDDLIAAGAAVGDPIDDVYFFEGRAVSPRGRSGLLSICATRSLIMRVLTKRTLALPNLIVHERKVAGLVRSARSWSIESADGAQLGPYDLVVDASGRRAPQSGGRLFEASNLYGSGGVFRKHYTPDIEIRTQFCRFPPGASADWLLVLQNSPPPHGYTGSQLIRLEQGRIQIAFAERFHQAAGIDRGLVEAVRSSLPTTFARLVDRLEPIDVERRQVFKTAQRFVFSRARSHPPAYVVIGDALMSTNPVYGLGIATAAIAARKLAGTLSTVASCAELNSLPEAFYRSLEPALGRAWKLSSWTDRCYLPPSDRGSIIWWGQQRLGRTRTQLISDRAFCHRLIRAANLVDERAVEVSLASAIVPLLRGCFGARRQATSDTDRPMSA